MRKVLAVLTLLSLITGEISGSHLSFSRPAEKIVLTGCKGSELVLTTRKDKIVFKSGGVSDLKVKLVKDGKTLNETGKPELDVKKLKAGKLANIEVCYTLDGAKYKESNIYVERDGEGYVSFVRSPLYKDNKEKVKDLFSPDLPSNDYLRPSHDIDPEDPNIKAKAEELCKDKEDDLDRLRAIYDFVTHEFVYDNVQLNDKLIYQDDSLSVLRRRMAVCEGFANLFAALCRASGIPATVQYGIGRFDTNAFNDQTLINESVPTHVWNAVLIKGKVYYCDPTFDNFNLYDGETTADAELTLDENPYPYTYFLKSEDVFFVNHKITDGDIEHEEERSGRCGENATFRLDRNATLHIFGEGELNLPQGMNGVKKVIFEEGSNITSIGDECFCDFDLLTEIRLPDSVKSIGESAFRTCEDLTWIYIPEGVESIGKQAFCHCDELMYVKIPESVLTIGDFCFDDCPRLVLTVPSRFKDLDKKYDNKLFRLIVT